jgi:DNA polymerase III epsilon subunit-like protein
MRRLNAILVFDFETNGLDTRTCEPIQVAGMALDPVSLKPLPGATFESLMRPDNLDAIDDTPEKRKALEINGKSKRMLADAPAQSEVWRSFVAFVKQFNPRGNSPFSAPLPAGKNIRAFDLPIARRLCETHKTPWPFNDRESEDLEDHLRAWFDGSDELPDYKMDTIRKYFGLSMAGAHDALVDVKQTAMLIAFFRKACRACRPRINFQQAFAKETVAP